MRPFRAWKDSDVVKELREAFTFWEVKPNDESVTVVNYQDDKKHPALLERRLEVRGVGCRRRACVVP